MKSVDAAWLAGLIDGEGSISISPSSHNKVSLVPTVAVSMTTPRVLKEIVHLTGFGRVSTAIQNGWGYKPLYRWYVVSRQAATLLREINPYMRLKKKQALLVIKVMDSRQGEHSGRKYGRSGLPHEKVK